VWERRGGENTHSPVPVWCYSCVAALAFESLGIGPYEVAMEWEKQASWDLAMIHRLWHAGKWRPTSEVDGWVQITMRVGIIIVERACSGYVGDS
jgi:hypothetical protein